MKLLTITILLISVCLHANKAFSNDNIKLYALDCGSLDVSNIDVLSSDGRYKGQSLKMANPCFLISHPNGNLLWDTGHIDSLAKKTNGEVSGVWHSKRKVTLRAQLKQLELTEADIDFMALSHIHPDHAGNANAFAKSTFIVNKSEREYMFSESINGMFGEFYSGLKDAKTIVFNEQHDVFNDESVMIYVMPGHTPGSSVLMVKLKNEGNIVLSGDLYIHQAGRTNGTMHQYNVDKQLTIKSRARFETLVQKQQAKVIIQHDKQHFENLPAFPKFID